MGGGGSFAGEGGGHEAGGGEEVVDAPAGVAFAGAHAVGPPGVDDVVGMEAAEGVDEATGEEVGEVLALLVGEAGAVVVGLWVLEVDFLMGDVEVAADEDGLGAVEHCEVVGEVAVPHAAVVETAQAVLGVGDVDVDEVVVVELEGEDAALVVVEVDADAACDRKGLAAGEDGGAGVAFLLGVVEVGLVAFETVDELALGEFCLLQADAVGVERGEDFVEAFLHDGAEAVDVPGYVFHLLRFTFLVI